MQNLALQIASCLLIAVGSINAQPDSLWSHVYGGEGGERCGEIIQTADCGYVMAGTTSSFGAGSEDFMLIKTNAEGELLWLRTYGSELSEWCFSLIQTSDGGFAMTGRRAGNCWLVRTDEEGDTLWTKTYGGLRQDACNSIIETADGGFALAGSSTSNQNANFNFWLIVTDEEGDSLWSRHYGSYLREHCNSLVQTDDGGFALAGFCINDDSNHDFLLIKTDIEGDSLWSRTFDRVQMDECNSLVQTYDGGLALAGWSWPVDADDDFWLVKTDNEGDLLWSRTYGGDSGEFCRSIIQVQDGGLVLAGSTNSFGAGSNNFWIVKTDEGGDSLWSQTFGCERGESCNSVIQTSDGGFALAGETRSFDDGAEDIWLVKTAPNPDFIPETGIVLLPSSLTLSGAYPNPFNSTTTVKYNIPYASYASLNLYNLSGQLVRTIVSDRITAGVHRTILNGSDMASGLYVIQLQSTGRSISRKVLLIK